MGLSKCEKTRQINELTGKAYLAGIVFPLVSVKNTGGSASKKGGRAILAL